MVKLEQASIMIDNFPYDEYVHAKLAVIMRRNGNHITEEEALRHVDTLLGTITKWMDTQGVLKNDRKH